VQAAGVAGSYDTFTAGFAAAFDTCEAAAQIALSEFHMDEVVRVFLREHTGAAAGDEVIAAISAQYTADWNRGTLFLPELPNLLSELAGRYRLSILSNTHYPALVHGNLAAMGIADMFAQVVTSVEVGVRKPHPAIFTHALAQLAAAPEQAIYVGDSYAADYAGATAAGMRAILIDPPNRYPKLGGARMASLFDLRAL
jgi:putative hydrolase of the HAD superfamily